MKKPAKTRAEEGTRDLVIRKVTLEGVMPLMFDRYPGDNDTKLALDSRKYKKFTEACAAYTMIDAWTEEYSEDLVLVRDGKPIEFSGFDDTEVCPTSGLFIKRDVARLEKGVPNPKVRPVLPLDWSLTFRLTIYPNDQIHFTGWCDCG